MSSTAQALNSLKNKMQSVRDELEKYRDLYEEKSREHQDEITKREEVRRRLCFLFTHNTNESIISP